MLIYLIFLKQIPAPGFKYVYTIYAIKFHSREDWVKKTFVKDSS